MVERKSGVVINISSLSRLMPTPLLSVYSASKSYVDIFSRGLCEEYKKVGITVQSVAPGPVVRYASDYRLAFHQFSPSKNIPQTVIKSNFYISHCSKLSKIRKPTLIAPTPEVFVKSALNTLGIESSTTGFWLHDLMVYMSTKILPEWLANKITYDSLKSIRNRALKKKAKEQ